MHGTNLNNPSAEAIGSVLRALHLRQFAEADRNSGILEQMFPGHPDVHYLHASIHCAKGETGPALKRINLALKLVPDSAPFMELRARIEAASGRFEAATLSYEHILKRWPGFTSARMGYAEMLMRAGRFASAIPVYDNALLRDPTNADAFHNRGYSHEKCGNFQAAIGNYTRAILLKKHYAQAHNNRGNAFFAMGRIESALADYDSAIAADAAYAPAYSNKGNALVTLKKYDEALVALNKALELDSTSSTVLNNMAFALQKQGEYSRALVYLDRAIAHDPNFAEAYNNRGHSLHKLERFHEALDNFQQAITLKHDYAEATWNRALVRLLLGDMSGGWQDLETRWARKTYQVHPAPRDIPRWGGEDLGGRSITVYVEQGFGDMIQMSRYLLPMIESGAQVTFAAPRIIHRLMTTLSPQLKLQNSYQSETISDYSTTIFSLPGLFRTTTDNVPAPVPYLHAEADLISKWRKKIGTHGFKIAISWQGNPSGDVDIGRSIPLENLGILSELPGVRLISIQYEHGLDQLADVKERFQIEELADFNTGRDGFIDTAAVMKCVDLVLTTDSAPAHLAGALGVPVWVMLMQVPDWRWMTTRADSPWYPTMRLFRQSQNGDWDSVIEDVKEELGRVVANASTARIL